MRDCLPVRLVCAILACSVYAATQTPQAGGLDTDGRKVVEQVKYLLVM
jgi:hypothetical protein